MPPKKRARTAAAAAASSSSSPLDAAGTKLTLCGGVPHHASLVALWRDDRLTDFAVSAEGVEFKAHRVALASCSGYFLNIFESGMRDAADATHGDLTGSSQLSPRLVDHMSHSWGNTK